MKIEGNEQSQRFDLILALLQKEGELSYHDKIALDENIKKLEMFLFGYEHDTRRLKRIIGKQESVIKNFQQLPLSIAQALDILNATE